MTMNLRALVRGRVFFKVFHDRITVATCVNYLWKGLLITDILTKISSVSWVLLSGSESFCSLNYPLGLGWPWTHTHNDILFSKFSKLPSETEKSENFFLKWKKKNLKIVELKNDNPLPSVRGWGVSEEGPSLETLISPNTRWKIQRVERLLDGNVERLEPGNS